MANRPKRTSEKDQDFFDAIVEAGGNITKACDIGGYARRSVYEWRAADKEFNERCLEAVNRGADVLESEAVRRALDGWDEPIVYKGEITGTVRKFSDVLLIFLLKGNRPEKYRERLAVDFSNATPEQLERAILDMPVEVLRKLLAKADADDSGKDTREG